MDIEISLKVEGVDYGTKTFYSPQEVLETMGVMLIHLEEYRETLSDLIKKAGEG